uniref:BEACH domain-containing protein n=1 Tax=Strigamia maritima TaxID=126957 RepID=T1J5I8_STRMM
MDLKDELQEIWQVYESKQTEEVFYKYLEKFYIIYNGFSSQISSSEKCEALHLTELPDELLPVLGKSLFLLQEQVDTVISDATLNKAIVIIRCISIICRNFDNIPFVASCDFICDIMMLASRIVSIKLDDQAIKNADTLLREIFSLFECLYDPYSVWRNSINVGNDKCNLTPFQPAVLHIELIPFFYDCFQNRINVWADDVSLHCIHLFGAILSGAEHNAFKLICPATLEILFKILIDVDYSLELKSLILQCLKKIVDVLRNPCPEQQVELSVVFDDYFSCLCHLAGGLKRNLCLVILMLDKLKDLYSSLPHDFTLPGTHFRWTDLFVRLFKEQNLDFNECHSVLVNVINLLPVLFRVVLSFREQLSFDWLRELLGQLSPVSDSILDALINLACEDESKENTRRVLQNPQVIEILLNLFPLLSIEQQERLSAVLLVVCCQHLHSRMNCCQTDVIGKVTKLLEKFRGSEKTAVILIQILKHLGRDSITSQQLKNLLLLLRPDGDNQYPYTIHLAQAISSMAKREGYECASHFWDFQDKNHGIIVPSIRRIPGTGFSVHVWLRLDSLREPLASTKPTNVLYRRHLYSFHTSLGMGFEAFFLHDGILVVAVCIKKEYMTMYIMDTPLDDGFWHSVAICHANARRPFSQSQVTVYIDGRLKASAQLKCPTLAEPFTYCRIGSPGPKTNVKGSEELATSLLHGASEKILSNIPTFFSLPSSFKSTQQDPSVKVIATGMQDKMWGPQQYLRGQMSSITVFSESLPAAQVKALYTAGANNLNSVVADENSEVTDISKVVFCYHAKACYDMICSDLSPGTLYEGRVTAPCHATHDIRDCINCIGGVYSLFPMLSLANNVQSAVKMPSPVLERQKSSPEDDDWIVVSNSQYSDDLLHRNIVASFLIMLRNFIKNHTVNQEHLLNARGIAIIAELLVEVPPNTICVHVLMAVQLLVESLGVGGHNGGDGGDTTAHGLLRALYQHVLFNFRIWNKSDFPVRIGHIQYLSTIIKDNRRYFRKKYGVQFFLDVIRHYYTSSSTLNNDDVKTIRNSLLGLIKYFLIRDTNHAEVSALLGFLISVKNEDMVGELLDMLLAIFGKLLFGIMANQKFSMKLKYKVLKFITALLKTDRVSDKHKSRLRLQDTGIPGLTNFLQAKTLSSEMAIMLLDFVLLSDKPFIYQGLLALLHLTREFGVSVKLQFATKLLDVLKNRPSAASLIAKQQSWQDSILCLLVKQPVDVSIIPKMVEAAATSHREISQGIEPTEFFSSEMLNENNECLISSSPSNFSIPAIELERPGFKDSIDVSSKGSSDDLSLTPTRSEVCRSYSEVSEKSIADDSEVRSLHESYKGDIEETEQEEVLLLKHVATVLATVFWRGIDGSDPSSWAERGRLFTCINLWALNNELFASHLELKRLILEHALQNAIADLNSSSGQLIASNSENARELMRWLYDFVVVDPNKDYSKKLSVELLDGVLCLLDTLLVFEESSALETWTEMTHLGMSFLVACAACDNLELCAVAIPKLHGLVQARSLSNVEEAGFLLGSIHSIIFRDVSENEQEHYSFLVPVLKALVEKVGPRLNIHRYLHCLPSSQPGPSFFEDFQIYCQSDEWIAFIEQHVKPLMDKYMSVNLVQIPDAMNDFWNLCYEATMIGIHTRNREWGECKLRFQSQILQPYNSRRLEESGRFQQCVMHIRNQSLLVKKVWTQMCVTLMGPRGAWNDNNNDQHWKLVPHENLSRMRLKLGVQFNFNDHADASQLRDNLGVSRGTNESLPLSLTIEAKANAVQEDSLEDEEINVLPLVENTGSDIGAKEKLILKENCELITLMSIVKGRLEITTTHVYFFDSSPIHEDFDRQDFKWNLSQLREVHLRRYNLRRSALELFLVDQTNYFLNFTSKTRNKVYSRLISLRPPNLFYHSSRTPAELLRSSGLIQKWVNREISNFDYLMQLNTIAGRTYNDLSQYPVFPWVLADFNCPELNLNDPNVFRDLSKPIGVVNTKKIAEVKAKYDDFEDSSGVFAKFHYGTHYSNSAGVLHYLVRLEPFTSLHVELQSGRFDVADRQFHSVPGTWRMLMESTNDVKELIPEFYYLPEFLTNMNNYDLGILQECEKTVNDVELPVWATDSHDFIYKHRQALESEYVSTHLHDWIDLIFGYKQKGEEAVKALNVFFYCSYEGAVDLDAVKSEFEREQLEKMINNFGQTPCQLIKEPHPPCLPLDLAKQRSLKDPTRPPSVFRFLDQLKAFYIEISTDSDPLIFTMIPRNQARSFIQQSILDNLITIGKSGLVGIHGWLPLDKFIPHYFTFDKDPTLNNAKIRKKIGNFFQPGLEVKADLFAVTHDGRLLITGGHWDNTIRVYSLVRGKVVSLVAGHWDVVTCLAIDYFGSRLVSGSRDTTCCVWELVQVGGVTQGLSQKPLQVLVGHSSPITCVQVMSELDTVVSGSDSGHVNVHSMRDGTLLRTIDPPIHKWKIIVSHVCLSELGQIVVVYHQQRMTSSLNSRHMFGSENDVSARASSTSKSLVRVFSINGHQLAQESSLHCITVAVVTGSHIVMGNQHGQLIIKDLHKLKTLTSLSLHIPILHLSVAPRDTHILACLNDGKLIVVGVCPRSADSKS